MTIIGLLIIISAVLLTSWWVCSDHKHKRWAVTACILALFAGTFIMLQDRAIEITIKYVGTIKAAAKQATTDAAAIADVKKRVKAQGATVDLVAKSAQEAKALVAELEKKNKSTGEKLLRLDNTMNEAAEALQSIEQTTEFTTTLLAAQNDNWEAFSQLLAWSKDKSYPLRQTAGSAYVKVRISYAGRITEPGYLNINWADGVDPATLPLAGLEKAYTTLNPRYHPHLVNVVWKRADLPKKRRMEFLVRVLQSSKSVCARHFAGKFFVSGTGDSKLKWQPFKIEPLLKWWTTNGKEIE
jgi:hypothetical protein